jgi:hypothetical protein
MALLLLELAREPGTDYRIPVGVPGEVAPVLYREDSAVSRVQLAVEQILFARNYTIRLLDQTRVTEWFRQPPDGVSHIAWQVGHLAFAGEQSTCECDQFAPVGQPAAGHKKTIKRSLWLQRRTYVPGETKRG